MSFDPHADDVRRDVDASMRMFEKSQVGPAARIAPIRPARILLVLDGSGQDETSIEAAGYLREACNVETLVLDAREANAAGELGLAADAASRVSGSRPVARSPGDAYDVILAAIDQHQLDLVIVPCPFGRDFEKVGADSAGTVIDVLLARCRLPLLVIRRDDQRLGDSVARISVVVGSECDVEGRAAAWAFGLAKPRAELSLNLVVEKEEFENIRSIVEAVAPGTSFDTDQLQRVLTETHHQLHGAMLKTAEEQGFRYRLLPQAGEAAPPNPLNESTRQLIVMPLEVDDRFGQGFVQDRIRRSPHPVLVVPGHVPR